MRPGQKKGRPEAAQFVGRKRPRGVMNTDRLDNQSVLQSNIQSHACKGKELLHSFFDITCTTADMYAPACSLCCIAKKMANELADSDALRVPEGASALALRRALGVCCTGLPTSPCVRGRFPHRYRPPFLLLDKPPQTSRATKQCPAKPPFAPTRDRHLHLRQTGLARCGQKKGPPSLISRVLLPPGRARRARARPCPTHSALHDRRYIPVRIRPQGHGHVRST